MKRSKHVTTIHIKRAYEAPSKADGCRVLVDRLWPRGIAKEAAHLQEWMKELAPSSELREWFGHDPARWEEFQRRYDRELDARPEQINALIHLADQSVITLVYAAKDETHNNAVALKNYLVRKISAGHQE